MQGEKAKGAKQEFVGSGASRGSAEVEKVNEAAAMLGLLVADVILSDQRPTEATIIAIRNEIKELTEALEAWHNARYGIP